MGGNGSESVADPSAGGHRAGFLVTMRGILVVLGLLMYIVSFFLWAVGDHTFGPMRGYFCAYFALIDPLLGGGHQHIVPEWTAAYFSLLGGGLINPLFLATFFRQLFKAKPRATVILRNLTILMIPFCWVVFTYQHYYPREGHILWIAGMLLTLFAMPGQKLRPPKEQWA